MALRWFGDGCSTSEGDLDTERGIPAHAGNKLLKDPAPAPDVDPVPPDQPPAHGRILLAEDDADMRSLLAHALVQQGYAVTECANGIQLLDHLVGLLAQGPLRRFDLIVSDIRMPGLTGLEIIEGLHGEDCCPPVILITAFGDAATHVAARLAGAAVTLDKPFEMEDLLSAVRAVLERNGGQ